MLSFQILLSLLLLISFGTDEQLASSVDVSSGTCDASGMNCKEASSNLASSVSAHKWKPFRYESAESYIQIDDVAHLYVKWHNDTLLDSSIPCEEKKAVVFSPSAGLGDSIGALTAAFLQCFTTGRLFFIDWRPYEWTVGFKALPFNYDYSKVKSLVDAKTGKPLLCVEQSNDAASFLRGHVTMQHAITEEPALNRYNINQESLQDFFIQPSPGVKRIVNQVLGSNKQQVDKFIVRLVALVIRTGVGEYNQFLSEGDEMNFVKCFRNYAKIFKHKSRSNIKFRVLVFSDNTNVKQNVIKALENGDNGPISLEVVSLDDSIVHLMEVGSQNSKMKSVKEKIRKTFAEFFLIGRCETVFLTHGSLFGRAAASNGAAEESDMYFLSDSHCDGHREKYSYLDCHEPKYPEVCGLS